MTPGEPIGGSTPVGAESSASLQAAVATTGPATSRGTTIIPVPGGNNPSERTGGSSAENPAEKAGDGSSQENVAAAQAAEQAARTELVENAEKGAAEIPEDPPAGKLNGIADQEPHIVPGVNPETGAVEAMPVSNAASNETADGTLGGKLVPPTEPQQTSTPGSDPTSSGEGHGQPREDDALTDETGEAPQHDETSEEPSQSENSSVPPAAAGGAGGGSEQPPHGTVSSDEVPKEPQGGSGGGSENGNGGRPDGETNSGPVPAPAMPPESGATQTETPGGPGGGEKPPSAEGQPQEGGQTPPPAQQETSGSKQPDAFDKRVQEILDKDPEYAAIKAKLEDPDPEKRAAAVLEAAPFHAKAQGQVVNEVLGQHPELQGKIEEEIAAHKGDLGPDGQPLTPDQIKYNAQLKVAREYLAQAPQAPAEKTREEQIAETRRTARDEAIRQRADEDPALQKILKDNDFDPNKPETLGPAFDKALADVKKRVEEAHRKGESASDADEQLYSRLIQVQTKADADAAEAVLHEHKDKLTPEERADAVHTMSEGHADDPSRFKRRIDRLIDRFSSKPVKEAHREYSNLKKRYEAKYRRKLLKHRFRGLGKLFGKDWELKGKDLEQAELVWKEMGKAWRNWVTKSALRWILIWFFLAGPALLTFGPLVGASQLFKMAGKAPQ